MTTREIFDEALGYSPFRYQFNGNNYYMGMSGIIEDNLNVWGSTSFSFSTASTIDWAEGYNDNE